MDAVLQEFIASAVEAGLDLGKGESDINYRHTIAMPERERNSDTGIPVPIQTLRNNCYDTVLMNRIIQYGFL